METLFTSVLTAVILTVIINLTFAVNQDISKAEQITLLSVHNLNLLDEMNEELQGNGEIAESRRKVKTDGISSVITVERNENEKLYLVTIKSEARNVNLKQTAVLSAYGR